MDTKRNTQHTKSKMKLAYFSLAASSLIKAQTIVGKNNSDCNDLVIPDSDWPADKANYDINYRYHSKWGYKAVVRCHQIPYSQMHPADRSAKRRWYKAKTAKWPDNAYWKCGKVNGAYVWKNKIPLTEVCPSTQTGGWANFNPPTCNAGDIWDTVNLKCREDCQTGFTWNNANNACETNNPCSAGYEMKNGVCVAKCTGAYLYDPVNDDCECDTGYDEWVNNGIMECLNVNECLYSVSNPGVYNVPKPFGNIEYYQTCAANEVCRDTDGSFACDPLPTCPAGEIWDTVNNKCREDCQTGFTWNNANNACESNTPCPAGYEMQNGSCVAKCTGAYLYDAANDDCECDNGYDEWVSNGIMECLNVNECLYTASNPGTYNVPKYNGQVTEYYHTCSANEVCRDVQGAFACDPLPSCPFGQIWDTTYNKCRPECNEAIGDRYDDSVGECVWLCSEGMVYKPNFSGSNSVGCDCDIGYSKTVDSNGDITCSDVNECNFQSSNPGVYTYAKYDGTTEYFEDCQPYEYCVNSNGGFDCQNNCAENAEVYPLSDGMGGTVWECACKPGYDGDGVNSCEDWNECKNQYDICNIAGGAANHCVNTSGSHECVMTCPMSSTPDNHANGSECICPWSWKEGMNGEPLCFL